MSDLVVVSAGIYNLCVLCRVLRTDRWHVHGVCIYPHICTWEFE
jgi:hypothetical protein